MNHPERFVTDIRYYSTAQYPCSYLPGHLARSQVAAPAESIDAAKYDVLIRHGFRRSGSFVYRPQCEGCQACLSIRLPVDDFQPNRSQKRAWAKHATLSCTVLEPAFVREHYELYQRYQRSRHAGGGMDVDDEAQYTDFLVRSNVRSWMVEFREPSINQASGELRMVSIIDELQDGLSAVYTFYNPESGQNLGTFNVLWQIEHARERGLKHLYLGYWINDYQKMAYKARFKPYELLLNGSWRRVPEIA